ncbi:hypothetical protein RIF29_21332 [Crotalaria pallida]|uniref:TIR domain-containing protein n=1 Tax=Crotalaria pallida TaxID=3830 RepID=A0AAN9I9E2_CROPI
MAATIKNPVSTSSSSTSSFTNEWTYDVFISFRGVDTRFGFAGYLYNALSSKGIKTFFDDEELQKGAEITPNLVKAIHQSRIAIVVFSENYASSRFCLDELATIMERSKDKGTLVLPVFYKVDPSNVRHLIGSYREAFDKHEERFKNEKDKIERWRLALKRAADLSGSHFRTDTYRYEYEFVGDIVQEVSKRINRTLLHVADYPIRVKYRVQEVNLLLDFESNKGVGMVGIYGIEGIGKTTLARAVYNSIADQFESLCFLADIRESLTKHELEQLQERLLYESIGEKDIKLWNVNKGIPIIKSRLSSRKVLLILDDINKSEQLKALAGELDWFGPGSRIIVTTRNQDLLRRFGIARTYEVESLSYKEARELFSWHAFKKKELLNPDFLNILDRVLRYCKGRPRYLETISSDLFGKTVWECFSTLRNLEIPSYKPERGETICKSKEKEEAHVHKYVTIVVIIEADMYEYEDVRFTGLYEGFMNRSFRIQEQTPFILLKEHLAEEFGIPVIYQRLWLSIPTGQQSRYIPLTPEQETQPVSTHPNEFQ